MKATQVMGPVGDLREALGKSLQLAGRIKPSQVPLTGERVCVCVHVRACVCVYVFVHL